MTILVDVVIEESIVAKNRSAPKTPEVASSVKTFDEPLSKTKFQKALEAQAVRFLRGDVSA